MELRRARPLSLAPSRRRERVLLGFARLHESQRVVRPRRASAEGIRRVRPRYGRGALRGDRAVARLHRSRSHRRAGSERRRGERGDPACGGTRERRHRRQGDPPRDPRHPAPGRARAGSPDDPRAQASCVELPPGCATAGSHATRCERRTGTPPVGRGVREAEARRATHPSGARSRTHGGARAQVPHRRRRLHDDGSGRDRGGGAVRLNHLRLTNFRLHVDTRIDFETGLTGIIGPNGSGKTTILEGIAWALYGMPAVRGKRHGVRSLAASGRASVKVELDFDLAGHRYRVVRTLSSAELYLDGASAPIANSTSAVTDLVRRRLGMSQQEFFNTYFTGQKELGVMAAMGPAERAQFLSRVLGYERLRGAQTLVRERRNVIKGEVTGLELGMPQSDVVARALADSATRLKEAEKRAASALDKLKKADVAITRIKPRWLEAQDERDAMRKLLAELRVQENEERGVARDAERLEREHSDIVGAQRAIAEISEELHIHKDLAAQLHEMERLFQEEGRRKELLRSRRTVEQEIKALQDRRGAEPVDDTALREAEAARDSVRKTLTAATAEHQKAHTDWVRDQQEASTKYEDYRTQYDETKRQRERLADLGPASPCPICTRPPGTHFREVLDEIDERLAEIKVNGKYFKSKIAQLKDVPPSLKELNARVVDGQRELERRERAITDMQLRLQQQTQ